MIFKISPAHLKQNGWAKEYTIKLVDLKIIFYALHRIYPGYNNQHFIQHLVLWKGGAYYQHISFVSY